MPVDHARQLDGRHSEPGGGGSDRPLAAVPSRLLADAAVRDCPSGMRRIATYGRVLSRRYLSHVHPLVVIALVPDGADIRAVHAERDAPSGRDADSPFVGARPVQTHVGIGKGCSLYSLARVGKDRMWGFDRICLATCRFWEPPWSLRILVSPSKVLEQVTFASDAILNRRDLVKGRQPADVEPVVLGALDARISNVPDSRGAAIGASPHFSGIAIAEGRGYMVDLDSVV